MTDSKRVPQLRRRGRASRGDDRLRGRPLIGLSALVATAIFASVLFAACGTEGGGESEGGQGSERTSGSRAAATTSNGPGREDATAASRPTSTPVSTPTAAPTFAGYELDLAEGAFWQYRWAYIDRSCAQGRGCGTDEDEGVFNVTLGRQVTVDGVPVYELQISGKSAVKLADTARDFAPRWKYMGVAGDQIVFSDG